MVDSTDELDVFVSAGVMPYEGNFEYVARKGNPYLLVLPSVEEDYIASVKCRHTCDFSISMTNVTVQTSNYNE
jgi:hypothetical protein